MLLFEKKGLGVKVIKDLKVFQRRKGLKVFNGLGF